MSTPVLAEFPAAHFVSASGVAIFHIKTGRVVLCYHTRDKYWFLPKGRRDAGESSTRAAEREGFEEVYRFLLTSAKYQLNLVPQSGFRNRLIPLPVRHRQPQAVAEAAVANVVEPVWTTLLPNSRKTQYLLHWYIAETLPPEVEISIGPPPASRRYQEPPPYPQDLRLKDRVAMEPDGYEPKRYENTGVDSEEALYTSELVHVREALRRLGRNSMSDVVAMGWDRIQARLETEISTVMDASSS